MQINYIILTHKNPQQLERLINRLDADNICFYIHIDKKTNIEHFKYLEKQNVVLIDHRIDVVWGDFSIVDATLNAMTYITENQSNRGGGYTILLSAQDYPIKTNKEIQEYLLENKNYDFIDLRKIQDVWSSYRERVVARKFNFSSQRNDFVVIFPLLKVKSLRELYRSVKSITKLLMHSPLKGLRFLLKKRNKSPFKEHYAESAWWAFRNETMVQILDFDE